MLGEAVRKEASNLRPYLVTDFRVGADFRTFALFAVGVIVPAGQAFVAPRKESMNTC